MDSETKPMFVEDYFEDKRQASRIVFANEKDRERGFYPSCRTDRFDWQLSNAVVGFDSHKKMDNVRKSAGGGWNELIQKTEQNKRTHRRNLTPSAQTELSKRVLTPELLGTPKFEGIKVFDNLKNENWQQRVIENHENSINWKHQQQRASYKPNTSTLPNTEGREQQDFTRLGRNVVNRRDQLSQILNQQQFNDPKDKENSSINQQSVSPACRQGQLSRGLIPTEQRNEMGKIKRNVSPRLLGADVKRLLLDEDKSVTVSAKDSDVNLSKKLIHHGIKQKISGEDSSFWQASRQDNVWLQELQIRRQAAYGSNCSLANKENEGTIPDYISKEYGTLNSKQRQVEDKKQETKQPNKDLRQQSYAQMMGEGVIKADLNAKKTNQISQYSSDCPGRSKSPQIKRQSTQGQYSIQQQQYTSQQKSLKILGDSKTLANTKSERSISPHYSKSPCSRVVSSNTSSSQCRSFMKQQDQQFDKSPARGQNTNYQKPPLSRVGKDESDLKSIVSSLCQKRQQHLNFDSRSVLSVSVSQRNLSKNPIVQSQPSQERPSLKPSRSSQRL